MHVNQKPRRRHSEEFKLQVLAACGEPGASVSAVALSFGLNANLVRQWLRGRGCKTGALVGAGAQVASPRFLALSLPTPMAAAATGPSEALDPIRVQLSRAALSVSVSWPVSASSQCAAWLRELLR